jgi:hypothetical protein
VSKQNQFGGLLSKTVETGERQKEQVLSGVLPAAIVEQPVILDIIKPEPKQFTEQFHEQSQIASLLDNKVLKEETHIRQTYMIDKELLKEFDKIARGKKKGFKTEVVNLGIKLVLQQMKK